MQCNYVIPKAGRTACCDCDALRSHRVRGLRRLRFHRLHRHGPPLHGNHGDVWMASNDVIYSFKPYLGQKATGIKARDAAPTGERDAAPTSENARRLHLARATRRLGSQRVAPKHIGIHTKQSMTPT